MKVPRELNSKRHLPRKIGITSLLVAQEVQSNEVHVLRPGRSRFATLIGGRLDRLLRLTKLLGLLSFVKQMGCFVVTASPYIILRISGGRSMKLKGRSAFGVAFFRPSEA